MASAQAMEEELQQSVLASDTTDWAQDASNANAASHSANKGISLPNTRKTRSARDQEIEEEDRDASGEDVEEDAEGEDDIDLLQAPGESVEIQVDCEVSGEDEDDEDEDAEGEEDIEGQEEDMDGEDEDAEGEDDEVEGLGGVKLLAPESDAEEDNESEASDLASGAEEAADDDSDAEEEVAWEDARAEAEEEDDESEAAASNVCIFCKQDEEHDPSEDFEAYMACKSCGENAHQQCARDEDAMDEKNDAKHWKCPTCYAEESEADYGDDQQSLATDGRPVSQRSTVPKMARDLLAVDTGSVDGDAHSVFNDLVLDDDPKDGSRHLRKRKTSSIEPDDSIATLRKRRRNTSADDTNDDATETANSGEASGSRSARTLRLKVSKPPPATVEKHTRTSLVIKLHVRPGNLKEIMSRKKRDKKRPAGVSRPSRPVAAAPARASHTPVPMIETPFTAESYSQPFYSFFDRDTDDAKGKPYGGILTDNEADTSKTLPQSEDRQRFDRAKRKADDEWRARVLAMQAESEIPIRRHKKNDHASQIECIEFGGWEIDTWYAAPYPAEYSRNRVLYICEFCLKYMNSDYVAWRHKLKCAAKHPPGDEIYRHGSISFFEVDGRKNPVYCQNLCLLAKLFLGSKTLYYDVEPFLFYVLCEYDETGYHFVGYFSKEKRSSSQNNVSCILTLPIHQRKGYGNLLIDFSYLLTKVEEKTGSPEKPLSDLGLVSYRSYWRLILCRYLLDTAEKGDHKANGLSIKRISDETAMTPDDVIAALEGLRALVRDPQTKVYAFRADLEFCRQYVSNWESKGHVKLKPEALAWTPYVMGRGNASHFELGPISTVAPRTEDEARIDEGPNGIGSETQTRVNGIKNVAALDDPIVASQGADSQLKAETNTLSEKVAGGDKENAAPEDADSGPMDVDVNEEEWDMPYKNIPPSRFEVFPPAPSRGRRERTQTSVSRPALQHAFSSSSAPRPRPKRPSGGSARRPTASRPKTNSARRKSGGTGRGPGRWPKGTKKADYGNADSGPGFPPGWNASKDTPSKVEGTIAKLGNEDVSVVVSDVAVDGPGNEANAQAVEDNEDVDAEGEDA